MDKDPLSVLTLIQSIEAHAKNKCTEIDQRSRHEMLRTYTTIKEECNELEKLKEVRALTLSENLCLNPKSGNSENCTADDNSTRYEEIRASFEGIKEMVKRYKKGDAMISNMKYKMLAPKSIVFEDKHSRELEISNPVSLFQRNLRTRKGTDINLMEGNGVDGEGLRAKTGNTNNTVFLRYRHDVIKKPTKWTLLRKLIRNGFDFDSVDFVSAANKPEHLRLPSLGCVPPLVNSNVIKDYQQMK